MISEFRLHVIHQRANTPDEVDRRQFHFEKEKQVWILSHCTILLKVRKPLGVSLSKIQPNSACQEAWMTFGAVTAIKRFKSYMSALWNRLETSIHWLNKHSRWATLLDTEVLTVRWKMAANRENFMFVGWTAMAGKAAMERNLVNRCEAPSIYKGGTRLNPLIPLHSCKGIWNVKTVKAKQMKKQRRGWTGLLSSVRCWKIHVNTRDVSILLVPRRHAGGGGQVKHPSAIQNTTPVGPYHWFSILICTFKDTDINDCIIRDLSQWVSQRLGGKKGRSFEIKPIAAFCRYKNLFICWTRWTD